MFQRFHALREEREGGFTLIELLVVILIIAILAAIAIPVFLRQREKGWVAQSQSALKNAATAQESWLTGSPTGTYTTALLNLTNEGFRGSPNVTITDPITAVGATSYCIQATHALLSDTHAWKISSYDSEEGTPEADNACDA